MRHLRTLVRDIFSFEAVFVLFLFAGSYKSLPLVQALPFDITAALMIAAVAIAPIIILKRRGGLQVVPWPYAWLCLVYFAYAAVSFILGNTYGDVASRKALELFTAVAWAIGAPLFIMTEEGRRARFLRLLVVFAVVTSVDTLARAASVGRLGFVGAFGGGQYQKLGRIAGIGLAIVTFHAIRHRDAVRRVSMACLGSLFVFTAFLAAARQAYVGIVIVLLYLLYTARRDISVLKTAGSVAFVLVLMATSVWALSVNILPDVDTEWGTRRLVGFVGSGFADNMANSARVPIWAESLQIWSDYPVFGAGFGSFVEVSSGIYPTPHNLFIEHLCELGLVGLTLGATLLVLWPLVAIARSVTTGKNEVLLTLGGVWIFVLTCSMFSGDLTDNRLLFTLSALLVVESFEVPTLGRVKCPRMVPRVGRVGPLTGTALPKTRRDMAPVC